MGMLDLMLNQLMPGIDLEQIMEHAKQFAESFQQIAANIKIIEESQARTELKLEDFNKKIEELQHLIITGEIHDYRDGHNPDAYYDGQLRNGFSNRDGDGATDDGDRIISSISNYEHGGADNGGNSGGNGERSN